MLLPIPPTDESLLVFGRRLRASRQARRLTLDALAEAAEVPKLHLNLIEQGRERPDAAAVHRLSGALHLPLHFLFSSEGDPSALRPL